MSVVAIVVLAVVSWYAWGFLVQSVNTRRGFAGDWFLGGFLSVVAVPFGIFYFVKCGASIITSPVAFFTGSGWGAIALGCGAVLSFLLPLVVLLIALVRPHDKNA